MAESTHFGWVSGRPISEVLPLVPREFRRGWDWFLRHEGKMVANLPYGKNKPPEVGYPLARMAGIHSPGYSQMRYPGKKYAISVHSSDLERYEDAEPVKQADGMWIFRYSGQDNDPSSTLSDFNGWLINNLNDGVPVGVMTKQPMGGYRVWGLATVISYEAKENMFWMRGPVHTDVELV